MSDDSKITYSILGDGETDIERGIISYQSPLASQLMKHEVGDEVSVKLPKGEKQYKVLKIDFLEDD